MLFFRRFLFWWENVWDKKFKTKTSRVVHDNERLSMTSFSLN